ncbi:hypothetical protein [Streptomyces sp. NPDC051994]|uniref:hypothetical protein n=1 Tax=unclassified Streptomyces TaxID=2593676 RepID=UPI00343ECD2C
MFSPATAPDVTETVVEAIREHRKYLNSGSRYITEHHTSKEIVGRFSAVAEAVVESGLHIRFSTRYGEPPRFIEERTVQFEAYAQCTGHGCINPEHKAPASAVFLLDSDADETAPAALPLVAAVRAWAQKHAETCRALPYTAR